LAVDADTADQLSPRADTRDEGFVADDAPKAEDADESAACDAGSTVRDDSSSLKWPLVLGLVVVIVLAVLFGWLGYRAFETRSEDQLRGQFLQAGRQAALNLTEISADTADADVARVLDSTTGAFHDDWAKRAPAFVDVVKQAQSKSTGSVTAAALDSVESERARVLVAVSVTSNVAGVPDQKPRAWRMRIDVQKVGDDVKVANVEFVP
jgi:Mce-associated membrane protein